MSEAGLKKLRVIREWGEWGRREFCAQGSSTCSPLGELWVGEGWNWRWRKPFSCWSWGQRETFPAESWDVIFSLQSQSRSWLFPCLDVVKTSRQQPLLQIWHTILWDLQEWLVRFPSFFRRISQINSYDNNSTEDELEFEAGFGSRSFSHSKINSPLQLTHTHREESGGTKKTLLKCLLIRERSTCDLPCIISIFKGECKVHWVEFKPLSLS